MSTTASAVIFVLAISISLLMVALTFMKVKRLSEEKRRLDALISDRSAELENKRKDFELLSESLKSVQHKLERLEILEANEKGMIERLNFASSESARIDETIKQLSTEREILSAELNGIKAEISLLNPTSNLIALGFYEEPVYIFETSQKFMEEIKSVREQQKKLIRDGVPIETPDSIAIIPNDSQAIKAIKNQSKLMLRAFNIECDSLISTIKPSNYSAVLERIEKVATDIEKLSASFACGFTEEYIELKLKECELVYQFRLKQQREKEEQDRIKEQMREEQKAIREYERALAKAQKEEEIYKDAIEVAKRELEVASVSDQERSKLLEKIQLLEEQLKEAEAREQRAISMAEQTKVGHVYIISNVGSFGEDVYKIGLTRRLDPLERVKELGDASVPFSFDVHAMIYSENAPMLESKLHREFNERRLNLINQRKEFFAVDLLEIQQKVKEITGSEVDFVITALAEEYYESLKLRNVAV